MQWNKDILKEARLKAKLSQSSLADELGVHFRTVQNWEKGTTSILATVMFFGAIVVSALWCF